jgi:site-specific DNA recombinase
MGGLVPLGYDLCDRQLVVNQAEAATVKHIFERYCELGSVRLLKQELDRDGVRSKRRVAGGGIEAGAASFSRGALYTLLSNPIYLGEIRHKRICHPGQHAPIVDRVTWDQTATLLREHRSRFSVRASGSASSPLIGKLFDEHGECLTPSHTAKGERRYRYYVSRSLTKGVASETHHPAWRLPAVEIERIVAAAAKSILEDKPLIVGAIEEAEIASSSIASILDTAAAYSARLQSEAEIGPALAALVDRVELGPDSIRLSIKLPVSAGDAATPTHLSLTRQLPMLIRRRGIEKRFIIDDGAAAASTVDPVLLKAVARAHCGLWRFSPGARWSRLPCASELASNTSAG